MFSCFSEKPGPLVAVMALTPATEAPMTAAMLPISSSICTYRPPTWGRRMDEVSATSLDGVMG